jgi:hypothetical protein
MEATMTANATKTVGYVVTLEPEYGSVDSKTTKRREMTLDATSAAEAAMIAVRGLLRMNLKTPPRSESRFHKDPPTSRRFVSRQDKEGDRWAILVDLSPAEKQKIADAEAAKEAADAAERAAVQPEKDAYMALAAQHPGLRVSVSSYSTTVQWEVRWSNDYLKVEIEKRRGYRGEGETYSEPATIRIGNGTMSKPAADLPLLTAALRSAAALAGDLDALYPVGSEGPDTDSYTANLRAHAAMLKRVVEVMARTYD